MKKSTNPNFRTILTKLLINSLEDSTLEWILVVEAAMSSVRNEEPRMEMW